MDVNLDSKPLAAEITREHTPTPAELTRNARAEKAVEHTKNLARLAKEGIPPMEWLVPNFIPARGITILGGPPKCYKTFFAQDLVLAVAAGGSWLGKFPTTQANVLYIDEENGEGVILRRFDQVRGGREMSEFPTNINLLCFEGVTLDTQDGRAIIERLIETYEPGLVVLDSMIRCLEGEENSASDVRRVFTTLKETMEEHQTSYVILHHTRKDVRHGYGALRGSGDFTGFADVVIMLSSTRGNNVKVTMEINRHIDTSHMHPFKVHVQSDGTSGPIGFQYEGTMSKPPGRQERCLDALRDWIRERKLKDFYSRDALSAVKVRGHSEPSYYEALGVLREEGEVAESKRGFYTVVNPSFIDDKDEVSHSK